jgi:hypothetical protein
MNQLPGGGGRGGGGFEGVLKFDMVAGGMAEISKPSCGSWLNTNGFPLLLLPSCLRLVPVYSIQLVFT